MRSLTFLLEPALAKWLLRLKLTIAAACLMQAVPAQSVSTAVDNIIPPSPEASALGKYAAIPVGLYTGTPQINIPLWELKEGDITLPISFSYHASGHKVDEIAPRTGMGWTLNAGGVITRTIMGEADEYGPAGFLKFSINNNPSNIYSGTSQELYYKWDQLLECGDAEPDQFSFNFGGYNGKFAFDWDRTISVSSERKVLIEPIGLNPGTGTFISGWKVTGEDGMVYIFEAKETSHVPTVSIQPCIYTTPPVSSWYLTRITSPNGHFITFTYQPYSMEYRMRMSETTNHRYGVEHAVTNTRFDLMKVSGQYLSRITTSSGHTTIDFTNGSSVRTDVPKNNAGTLNTVYSLSDIIVTNKDGQKLKHFQQGYDYSIGRLTLKTITELPVDGSTPAVPPYRFTYYGSLPAFTDGVGFANQDHWGYVNINPKGMLTPPYIATNYNGSKVYYDGGDRSPSAGAMRSGILTQIKYPTGGTTTFDFEPHDYSFIGNSTVEESDTINVAPVSVSHSGNLSTDFTTATFTVNDVADERGIYFNIQTAYCSMDGFAGATMGPVVLLLDANGNTIRQWTHTSAEKSGYMDLGAGTYTLKASTRHNPCWYEGVSQPGWDNAHASFTWKELSVTKRRKNKTAGGLRVRTITDFDGISTANNIVRKFEYRMPENGIQVSSGVITEEPRYTFNTTMYEQSGASYMAIPYVSRISNSVIMLGTTQGSHIGYRQVNVLYGDNGELGKTEATYTSFFESNDQITYELPFQAPRSYDYLRGLLKKQVEYKYENGTYTAVKQVENDYVTRLKQIPGYKVGEKCNGCRLYVQTDPNVFAVGGYTVNLGSSRIATTKETVYENGQSFVTERTLAYDPALQFVVKETVKGSDNKHQVTEFSYPFQYTAPSAIISQMQARHIMSPVLEKIIKEKAADGTEKITGGSFTQFDLFDNKILPSKQLRFTALAPVTDLVLSKSNSGNYDTRYYTETSVFNRYSSLGMTEQATAPGDAVTSYIWGYGGLLPIAQITNAAFNRCAYTGFESSDKGNWSYDDQSANYSADAKTGRRSFSGVISSAALPSGQYIVSLWTKASSGASITVNGISKTGDGTWKRLEWIVTDPASITINTNGNLIDDLRLHPREAQMKTLTYLPHVGISSLTDAVHSTLYYEYDAQNRLKTVKDREGNIIKNYKYQFAGN